MRLNHQKNKYLLTFICLVFIALFGYGQRPMTKIKDNSKTGTSATPESTVILELESLNKGFLAPRMSTAQRDAIEQDQLPDGLIIFNTTSGCVNYWSGIQSTWLSLCGTPPPAIVSLTSVQCNSIETEALKQGVSLNTSNKLLVPVTVSQAGTYDILVKTDNGYYYHASGTFPSTGTYDLILQGVGTPIAGYNTGSNGDQMTITMNGKISTCQPYTFVEKADVSYELKCATISIEGDLFINVPLNETNKLKVTVEVANTGSWNIRTNTVNGISYSGNGTFTTSGSHTVELVGNGTPAQPGSTQFILTSNSADGTTNCPGIEAVVKDVAFTMNCADLTVEGNYKENVSLNDSNYIILPVQVLAPGKTIISTNTIHGMQFSSGEVVLEFNPAQNNIQEVVLRPTIMSPTVVDDYSFTISANKGTQNTCTASITIDAQDVAFTFLCNEIVTNGKYAPGVTMDATNSLQVKVNVQYRGNYQISTDEVNGVKFQATGTFSTTGEQTVILNASGTPVAGGRHNFRISSNSNATTGNRTCLHPITFVYRTMNILVVPAGENAYTIASGNSKPGGVLMRNTANFGRDDNSIVKVENLNMITRSLPNATNLRNYINSDKIDIIWISISGVNRGLEDVLTEFVNDKKGVLILSQEANLSDLSHLIDRIGSVVTTSTAPGVTQGSTVYTQSNLVSAIDDPILNGSFGDIRSKYLGNDATNGFYWSGFPADKYTVLATKSDDTSWAWSLKHKTKGFVIVGDGGWLQGTINNASSSASAYPTLSTNIGVPLSRPGFTKVRSSSDKVNVENAFFLVNMMEWAIKFSQENTNQSYIMTGTPQTN